MSSMTRQQMESWLKTIEIKGGKILDCGGSQNPLSKSRLKVFEPDEYKILDLSNPHECKQKPDIVCDLNLIEDIHTGDRGFADCWQEPKIERGYIASLIEGYFDMAFCLEVSEYWWNPVQALRNINYLLKQGGELYISFHFCYPTHNPVEQDYLRYTPQGVLKLLKETGFEIVEMKGRLAEDEDMMRTWWGVEGMRPAKEYYKHNWVGCLIHAKTKKIQ